MRVLTKKNMQKLKTIFGHIISQKYIKCVLKLSVGFNVFETQIKLTLKIKKIQMNLLYVILHTCK